MQQKVSEVSAFQRRSISFEVRRTISKALILLIQLFNKLIKRMHRHLPDKDSKFKKFKIFQSNVSCQTLKRHQRLLQKLSLSRQLSTRCFEREFNPSLARTGSHLLNWSVKSIRHAYVCAHSRLSPPVSLFRWLVCFAGTFCIRSWIWSSRDENRESLN